MPTESGFSLSEKDATKKARREGESESWAGLESETPVWTHDYFYPQIAISVYIHTCMQKKKKKKCTNVSLYT